MAEAASHTRMHLSLVLMRGEEDIAHGSVLVTPMELSACLGDVRDVRLPALGAGRAAVVKMVSGLVVDHHTDGKGAALFLRLFEVADGPAGPEQRLVFRSASRIPPGYDTPDFESMGLAPGYELVFRTRWLD